MRNYVRRDCVVFFFNFREARLAFITFHRCHLLWAIIPRARERRLRRRLRRPRPSTVYTRDGSTKSYGSDRQQSFTRDRRGGDVAARYTVTDARGFARANLEVITKRRPHRPAARPSCYSYHSSLSPSPSFSPCLSFALSPFLFPSLLKHRRGYRRTPTHLRQLIDISPSSRISVTKLPCLPIFSGTLIN